MIAISRPVRVMVPLAAAVAAYPLLPFRPGSATSDTWPSASWRSSLPFWGIVRQGPARPRGWLLVLCGYLGWFIGDSVHTVGVHVVDIDAYPGPADVAFVVSSGLVACGLLLMVRRRSEPADLTAVLDVAVLAAGLAVVAGVVLIAPIARDSSLTLAGKVTSSAYPMADLLLLSILVRLWTKPGAKTDGVPPAQRGTRAHPAGGRAPRLPQRRLDDQLPGRRRGAAGWLATRWSPVRPGRGRRRSWQSPCPDRWSSSPRAAGCWS